MTIAARITSLWPKTEALLLESIEFDYDGARDQAISDVIATLYATYAPAADVPELEDIEAGNVLVQQQVAEITVLQLIQPARDVYMQEARRLTGEEVDGWNTSRENTDKMKALDTLAAELRLRIAERAALVAGIIQAGTTPPTAARVLTSLFAVASGTRGL